MVATAFVLTNTQIYYRGADLTGYSNKVEVASTVDDQEATTFGSAGWKERLGGLFDFDASIEGLFSATDLGQPDDALFADLGNATAPLTLVPTGGGAIGDVAYPLRVLETSYQTLGEVGAINPFTAEMGGDWPVTRGRILNGKGTARTLTGTATPVQVGALLATQRMYATLHVLSVTGTNTPTLTVALQSDNAVGFLSPTTQHTFTAFTAIGGETTTVAGPVTDDYWRASYTISGTDPSFLFALAVGIGPI